MKGPSPKTHLETKSTDSSVLEESDEAEISLNSSVELKQIHGRASYQKNAYAESLTGEAFDSSAKNRQQHQSCLLILYVLALFLCCIAVALAIKYSSPRCSKTLDGLKDQYKHQDNELWAILQSILDKDEEAVNSLVLLHSSVASDTVFDLGKKIAEIFSCTKFKSVAVTTLGPSELNKDYGDILKRLQEMQLAVVTNVSHIQFDKAQIFHTLCDDVTKFKKPSLYVFLLKVPDSSEKPIRRARRVLQSVWKDLPHNILDPLLSRILGHVITILPEP